MTNKEAIKMQEAIKAGLKETGKDHPYRDALIPLMKESCDMAIEALEGNGMTQERKYTFGNDGFSLENAYHDCKLVFDGITDDDSFQKADTGLILYYANEIIYALHEALKGKDANVPSRKGVFIPDITVEMFRNASLEGVEDLMASGVMEDISLTPAQPDEKLKKCRFEYINACRIVTFLTPDTTKKDISDAYAVIKALQPIFGDVAF